MLRFTPRDLQFNYTIQKLRNQIANTISSGLAVRGVAEWNTLCTIETIRGGVVDRKKSTARDDQSATKSASRGDIARHEKLVLKIRPADRPTDRSRGRRKERKIDERTRPGLPKYLLLLTGRVYRAFRTIVYIPRVYVACNELILCTVKDGKRFTRQTTHYQSQAQERKRRKKHQDLSWRG